MSYHKTPTFQGEPGDPRGLHGPVSVPSEIQQWQDKWTPVQRSRNYHTADSTGDGSIQLYRHQLHSIVVLIGQGSMLVNFWNPGKKLWRQLLKSEERRITLSFQLLFWSCWLFQAALDTVNSKRSCRRMTNNTRWQCGRPDSHSWSWLKDYVSI